MSDPYVRYWSGNSVRLANSVIVRPMQLPPNWNKLRIGVLLGYTTGSKTTVAIPCSFFIGLCSGYKGYGISGSTTNFVGITQTTYNLNYISGTYGMWYTRQPTNIYPIAGYGSTSSFGAAMEAGGTSTYYTCIAAAHSGTEYRGKSPFYVDITKGSPTYTLQCFYTSGTAPSNNAQGQVSESIFLREMTSTTPTFDSAEANVIATNSKTMPVSEASGSLDSINISWNREDPNPELLIHCVAISILS